MPALVFPPGFLWGVATSAPQIEGGVAEGGRGESIWDRYAATPGKIGDGSNLDVACDHYHRWPEDVRLLQWLGAGAYRLSLAWPRIQPTGRGTPDARGLDYYDGLVDALLESGIQPFVTLYHWDLPQRLQDEGGWTARGTAAAFAEYAAIAARRLGDRVRHWITHNEPWCVSVLGYEEGEHAPGYRDPQAALHVAHHLLLSHAWAMDAVRQNAPGSQVGITLNLTPAFPASDHDADQLAARRFDGLFNRWFLDPLFRGRYPQDTVADRIRRGHLPGGGMPFVHDGDLQAIARPMDFLGINYYSRVIVRANEAGDPVAVPVRPPAPRTEMGWEIFPQGLHELLVRIWSEYRPPKIYITENGAAFADRVEPSGRVPDTRRVEFLHRHLTAAHRAIADGVPLRGYFVWSLLDNFEWAQGFTKRFGLYWVDFATQQRVPKESAFWFRAVAAAGAVEDASNPGIARRLP